MIFKPISINQFIFLILLLLVPIGKFNSLVQNIFFNKIYQISYPSISNTSSNTVNYGYLQYRKTISKNNNNLTQLPIIYNGIPSNYSLDTYSNSVIYNISLIHCHFCILDPIKNFYYTSIRSPNHHHWFDISNFKHIYSENFSRYKNAFFLPYSQKLPSFFYIMNIYSLFFCLNDTFFNQYPILFANEFQYFEDILNLTSLNYMKINESKIVFVENVYMFDFPDPYNVAYFPMLNFVKKIKSMLKSSESSSVIYSSSGDKRILGKNLLINEINNSLENQLQEISLIDNSSFSSYISMFVNAKIALSFTSELMILAPFMKEKAVFIEIQFSRIISRNALLASAFGLNVYLFSITKFNISRQIINDITKIIKKSLNK